MGDGQLGRHRGSDNGKDLLPASLESPSANGVSQLGVVCEAEPAESFGVLGLQVRTERDLAADHGDDIGGHPGVEAQSAVGSGHDVGDEELANGIEELEGRRRVVQARPVLGHRHRVDLDGASGDPSGSVPARSSRRSHSTSQTRRPMAASSTDRSVPDRWVTVWTMQITPQRRVPRTSHQWSAVRSTVVPLAPS